MQSIHREALDPDHIPLKMWTQVWQDLQNHKEAILMELLVVIQRTSDHGQLDIHFTYLVDKWEGYYKPGM